jgi:hypothetical protein
MRRLDEDSSMQEPTVERHPQTTMPALVPEV